MLQSIRNLVTGWVAVIFVALLIIPFAFFGINYYFNGGTNINAVTVNGTDVSLLEYQQSYQNTRARWQEINPRLAGQTEFIQQQTLDNLIDRVLVRELRNELGFRVSDDQVRKAIANIPLFRNPEGFDTVAYQNYLLSAGYTPARFEATIREDLTMQQLQTGLLQSLVIPRTEIQRMAVLLNQTRDIEYAVVAYEALKEGIEVTDEDVQAYYQQRDQEFMEPEKVRVAYIQLSIDDIARDVTVDAGSLMTFFEGSRQNYNAGERRKIRQILVYADKANTDEAQTTATRIYEQLQSGSTFEEIEKEYSDNTEINVEVSDFGYLNRGVLDTVVDEVAFSIERGVISTPVLSEFGYHLLQVEDISGGEVPEFEQVREQVETDYRREQAEKRFFELYDQLAVLVYEHPDTLVVAAEDLGLDIRESEYLTRTLAEEPLLNNPEILAAAFSEDVLLAGNNSKLIELDPDNVIVIRVIDHQAPQKKPLSEIYNRIVDQIRLEKGAARTQQLGEEVIAALEQGTAVDALASEYPLEWKQAKGISRDSRDVDMHIVRTAFSSASPGNGQNTVSGVAMDNGDYAVVITTAVHDVDSKALTADAVQPVIKYFQQTLAADTWSRIVTDLRENARIVIHEANLQ